LTLLDTCVCQVKLSDSQGNEEPEGNFHDDGYGEGADDDVDEDEDEERSDDDVVDVCTMDSFYI